MRGRGSGQRGGAGPGLGGDGGPVRDRDHTAGVISSHFGPGLSGNHFYSAIDIF